MAKVLLYTIGNSDLLLCGEQAADRRNSFRETTEVALEQFGDSPEDLQNSDAISFPMFSVLVDFLEQKSVKVDRVVFFASNQPENEPQRDKDTVFAARLLEKYAAIRLGGDVDVSTRFATRNPADLDSMYDFFMNYYDSEVRDGKDEFILCITAGTPAFSNALTNIFSNIPFSSRILYIDRGSREVRNIAVARTLYYRRWKELLKGLVSSFNYGFAAAETEKGPLNGRYFADLLRVMNHIENFCLEHAAQLLNNYMKHRDEFTTPAPLEALARFCDMSVPQVEERNMCLLFSVMRTRFSTGRIAEAVALMFRFREALLKYYAGQLSGIDFEKQGQQLIESVNAVPGLAKHLDNKFKFWMDSQANHRLYLKILSFYKGHGSEKDQKKLMAVQKFADRVMSNKFDTLRHNGPYAHGFSGVTSAEAMQAFGGKFVDETERFISNVLEFDLYDPFVEMHSFLLEEIEGLSMNQ